MAALVDAAAQRLQTADPVAAPPGCAAARQDATNNVAAARQLDALTRQALGFATRSYCS